MNGDPILDTQVLENLRAAIGDRLAHIIQVYLEEVPRSFVNMRAALDKQDYETIRITIHALKSSSANVGAMQVSRLAAELEHKLIEKSFTNVAADLNNIEKTFDQVRPMFLNYT